MLFYVMLYMYDLVFVEITRNTDNIVNI